MSRVLADHRAWLLAACLLVSTGCPGGESNGPTPHCSRWAPAAAPGPGDVAGFFPRGAGDLWTARFPGTYPEWQSLEVTGARTVLGRDAVVLTAFDLDTRNRLGESYRAVDDHGVVELGNDDAGDEFTPLLVPYYVARFPVTAGDSFTSVDCTDLDYGADVDGDGKNERIDVRIVVTVAAVEPVVTDVATFPAAARIEQRLTASSRTTRSGEVARLEALLTEWYSPGAGLVRQSVEIPAGSPPARSALTGYRVAGAARGLVSRGEPAMSVRGPYAVAFDSTRFLQVGQRQEVDIKVVGVPVAVDGSAGASIDLLSVPRDGLMEVSPPALAVAAGGVVAAVASTWNGVVGDVRLQRRTAEGALLELAQGRNIGPAVSFWPYACGPAVASDGTGFLVVTMPSADRLRAVRIGGDGAVLGATDFGVASAGAPQPGCAAVAFDGAGYLVLYQAIAFASPQDRRDELRAVHISTAGVVLEDSPIVLSATGGLKRPRAVVFDGASHFLLLEDGRGAMGAALMLRRITPAGALADGDAATGGVVLSAAAPTNGGSLVLSGATPVASWPDGDAIWVTRFSPDGLALDLHGGLPGVDVYLGDPASCGIVDYPTVLWTGEGAPQILYLLTCSYPVWAEHLRAIRFGL